MGNMIKLMTERRINIVIPILAKAKKSYNPLASPSQTTREELFEANLILVMAKRSDPSSLLMKVALVPFLTSVHLTIFLGRTPSD